MILFFLRWFDLFVKVDQFVLLMTRLKIFENFHLLSQLPTDAFSYGTRVIIPESLRKNILLFHEGHFGIERTKQLAHTVVLYIRG